MVDNGNNGNKGASFELDKLNEFIHSQDSTDKAFKNQDTLNALRLMVLSDPEFLDNAMRYDLPNSRTILAIALSMQKCIKHNYKDGINFYKVLCGLLPSKQGKRIDQMVDAIGGDRRWREGDNKGFMDNMKQWASGQK